MIIGKVWWFLVCSEQKQSVLKFQFIHKNINFSYLHFSFMLPWGRASFFGATFALRASLQQASSRVERLMNEFRCSDDFSLWGLLFKSSTVNVAVCSYPQHILPLIHRIPPWTLYVCHSEFTADTPSLRTPSCEQQHILSLTYIISQKPLRCHTELILYFLKSAHFRCGPRRQVGP